MVWQDGQSFTAEDVAFTLERARSVPNSLGGFENLVRPIVRVDVVDPLTLRLVTRNPVPNLPMDLTSVAIVSAHIGRSATTADYNSGRAVVGTGPYRFVSYVPGDRLVLARNDLWWGPKQPWEGVVIRMIPNIAARTAALLAADVDIIDSPSAEDLPRLRSDPGITVVAVPGSRIAYINPIYRPASDAEPVTDKEGKKLAATPLGLLKVRQALSLAINREAIADRVLGGTGVATGQWVPPGSFTYDPAIPVPRFDPAAAKTLLAEAGFPDGFRLTLSTANDRTPYAVEVAQAVAQMWSRVGVQTSVEGMPYTVYSPRGIHQQFQVYFGTLSISSMEAGLLLRSLLMTPDAATGVGTYNWSRYSNPALDALVGRALATVDDQARERLLIEAVHLALSDQALIPLYEFRNIWALRKGFTYDARADELTLAMGVHPAP